MQNIISLLTFINQQFRFIKLNSAKWKQLQGLQKFISKNIKDIDVTTINYHFIRDFKNELENTELSQNTKFVYYNTFKDLLKEIHKLGYTKDDLSKIAGSLTQEEIIKEVLTNDEVNTLFNYTPRVGKNLLDTLEVVKDMALISLYTGLRFVDIQKLDFNTNVVNLGDRYVIRTQQKKTSSVGKPIEIHPNIEHLFASKYNGTPFSKIDYHNIQYVFKQWASVIGRNVTFHIFRHTFAMKLYSNNVDILTISTLLGHKNINTTQNYVKSIDINSSNAIMGLSF